MTVLQFCLLGLGTGALYGVAALGMVLIYRGSGVINLAHGAVGMVGTYLYWYIHDERGQHFVAGLVPALLLCALLGFAVQRLVMHPLRASSPVSRLLATLGVLATLQGAVALRYPDEVLVVAASLPTDAFEFGDLRVGKDRMIILLVGVVLAVLLGLYYRFTRFGLATSAVAENPRVAGHLGYSANGVASANWALGSMLAGLAGILLSPITGLQTTALTLLVVPALAAALFGSMTSFPITMAAGLAIGVAQSLLARYVSTPGWASAVPFVLVLIVLVSRGTALPVRGEVSLRLPSIGTGRIRWGFVAVALAAGITALQVIPLEWVDGANVTVLSAIVVLSVVVVTGYAGQVSLAQVALAGTATLVASRLIADAEVPFLLALLIGMLVAIPIGVVVGLPALRSRGSHLAIATLAMSVAVEALVLNRASFTNGDVGVSIGFPEIFGLDINNIIYPRRYATFGLVAFTLVALAVANLRRGRSGRRLVAVRANERAAASLGVSVVGAKLYAFALSAMLAALGGMLLAFRQPFVVFSSYRSFDSVTYVANSVIGGVGYVVGPLLGATLQVGGLGTKLGELLGDGVQKYLPLIGGIILIYILIKDPDGIAASMARNLRRLSSLVSRGRPAAGTAAAETSQAAASAAAEQAEQDVRRTVMAAVEGSGSAARTRPARSLKLEARGVSVRFGGTYALRDVSIEVNPGEVVGLIGPNGSGKTTLMDVMTGFVTPVTGTMELDGVDIGKWSPRRRGAAGIARSFQSLELFEDMTVMENLLVASERRTAWANVTDLVAPGRPQLTPHAVAAIDRFRLWGVLSSRPQQMPYGLRRLLAIARSVACEPSVLLLDESASGLSPEERDELSSLVRTLAHEDGIGVLLIEHDVDLVMRTSDRVVALEFGQVIAQGTPDEVRSHPDVIRSYLGDEPDAADTAVTYQELAAGEEPATVGVKEGA